MLSFAEAASEVVGRYPFGSYGPVAGTFASVVAGDAPDGFAPIVVEALGIELVPVVLVAAPRAVPARMLAAGLLVVG